MAAGESVKMIVSYGGEIRRCPRSGKARYAGGENRLVKVGMSERLGGLRARLAALAGYPDVRLRYAIVADGLDALHGVESEADLWKLVTLLYCRSAGVTVPDCRVRAFLFLPVDASPEPFDEVVVFVPKRMRQSASSPSLLPVQPGEDTGSLTAPAADAASLARAQSDSTLYAGGSSAMTSGAAGTRAVQPDSGFEALAAIAAEQRSAAAHTSSSSGTSSSGGGAGAGQGDSGFAALAAVAAEQKRPSCPAPAPVLLVPVAPLVAVFYPVIPVYPCLILAGL